MKLRLILVSVFLIIFAAKDIKCDESPGFFLKVVSKNIPRIGRRSDPLELLFRKSTKNVPRIGRRSGYIEPFDEELPNWYTRFTNPSKRIMQSGSPFGFFEYNVIQPIDSNTLLQLLAKDMIPNDGIKFITWKDFDKALQQDNELFSKLVSLGKDSLDQLKNELISKGKFSSIYGNDDLIYYNNEVLSNGDKEKMEYQLKNDKK